jgi:anaerobic selenocysteine-containing dehydrogenase
MNDSFANDGKIARRIGGVGVTLNPADAAARGLVEGDRVRLWNETGSLEMAVAVSDIVPAGVAYSPKGRWPKREPERFNVNVLNDGRKSDIGDSSSVHGIEVVIDAI